MAENENDRGEQRGKARARLALRAERAMGLGAIRYHKPAGAPAAVAARASVPRSAPALVAPASVALDGPAMRPRPPIAPPAAGAERAALSSPRRAAAPVLIPDFEPAFDGPALPLDEKRVALQTLDADHVKGCTKCVLCESRTKTVFGEGDVSARLMFIGEGPGENEDLEGRPFVGRAGQLLDKMIVAMGLTRAQVFIANIVKCRPPNNRQPAPDETAACTPYLLEQIRVIRPQVIVTLGLPSTQYILRTKLSMSKLRGQWQPWRGIKVMPTYHPAYVLRSYTKETREAVWSDLQMVLTELGLPPRGNTRG